LRERNSLLHEENDLLAKWLNDAENELIDFRTQFRTMEEQLQMTQVENTAIASKQDSFEREAEAWKMRVQSLVS